MALEFDYQRKHVRLLFAAQGPARLTVTVTGSGGRALEEVTVGRRP